MLTSKQRAEFRAQANSLETTLMVGKDGVTEAVIAEADKLLTARELVKGKVLETALMSAYFPGQCKGNQNRKRNLYQQH